MELVALFIAGALAGGDIGAHASAFVAPVVITEIGPAATCDEYGNMTEVWSDGTTAITVGGCLATY
jgi:hypothetical protein